MNRILLRACFFIAAIAMAQSISTLPCRARAATSDDGPVKLQMKFAKGKDFFVEAKTTTKQDIVVKGERVPQNQEALAVWHWQPQELTSDGNWLIRVRCVRFRYVMDLGRNHIVFDSSMTGPGDGRYQFAMAVLRGLNVTVQPDGVISKIVGREEILKAMTDSSNTPYQALFPHLISEEATKQQLFPFADFLPQKPVSRGDQWARHRTIDIGPIGRFDSDWKYTYSGKLGALHEFRLTTKTKYQSAQKGDKSVPFTIKSADLTFNDGEGKLTFDAEKGRLQDGSLQMNSSGFITVQMGDETTKVELKQTQTSRVRTMERAYSQKEAIGNACG
jgi:hypothetical protein